MLALTRDTCVRPASVIHGTPSHSVSHVVVVPLYGNESSAMSADATVVWPLLMKGVFEELDGRTES
jgi:hypothetical protein